MRTGRSIRFEPGPRQVESMAKIITWFLEHPDELERQVGFKDLPLMHGEWIRDMMNGTGDYTLQAHWRNSTGGKERTRKTGLAAFMLPEGNPYSI